MAKKSQLQKTFLPVVGSYHTSISKHLRYRDARNGRKSLYCVWPCDMRGRVGGIVKFGLTRVECCAVLGLAALSVALAELELAWLAWGEGGEGPL